ncbi:hypothetical protein QAD02_004017 [Eretmocerus hayati]|uniref:Uncharacterized protein n=1 Tax=Eretmocerus hayati TaxID=131215 RepID=A0ACC2NNT0_9HYME|nr:hypothetical protein QAD02_004017 [Eretmocerus hayati]
MIKNQAPSLVFLVTVLCLIVFDLRMFITPYLPEGWETLNSSSQMGLLDTAIQSQSIVFTQILNNFHKKFDTFTALITEQSERINVLENENHFLREELEQLRSMHVSGQSTSERKVTGIPRDCQIPLEDIPRKILKSLQAESLSNGILQVREFTPKTSNSREVNPPSNEPHAND